MIERPTPRGRALCLVRNIATGRCELMWRVRRCALSHGGQGPAGPLRRQEAGLEVDARSMAQAAPVQAQPLLRLVAPGAEEVVEQGPVRLQRAVGAERTRVAAGFDQMKAVRGKAAIVAACPAEPALGAFAHRLDQLNVADE